MGQLALPDRKSPTVAVVCLALLLLTGAAYVRVLGNGFVNYDDPVYVTENSHVLGGLSRVNISWALTSTDALNWHPLTWLSLQLDSQLYGSRAWGFHLTNLLLHLANTALVFLILRTMTGSLWRSALVAALFGLHPLHVESVAWVAERKDVLSTFFGLAALGIYVWYARRPAMGRYLVVAAALGLSLSAKAMFVTLPFVLLLLDYWPLGRLGPAAAARAAPASCSRAILEKLPLLALAGLVCVVTIRAQARGAVQSLEQFPLPVRLANALVSYGTYLGKLFWPMNLAPFYPHPGADQPAWQVVLAGVLLAAVTGAALAAVGRRPYLAVGWLWFIGTLVPVIGLVQVGDQALADRYCYFPSLGFFLMVVWAVAELAAGRPAPQRVLTAVACAALLACLVGTWMQLSYWHDSAALWRHALEVTDDNHVARNNLGAALLKEQNYPAAEVHLRQAVRLRPDFWLGQANLGTLLDSTGRRVQAIPYYRQSLEGNPNQPVIQHNLGVALAIDGRLDEAVVHLRQAVALEPDSAEYRYKLAWALCSRKDFTEAVEQAERAVRLAPTSANYRLLFAQALRGHGELAEADAQEREVRRLGGQFR